MVKKSGAKKGMTLLEVLVAALILSIAIAGSLGISLFAYRSIKRSEGKALALNYARQVHEQLKSLHYNKSPEMDIGAGHTPGDAGCLIPDIPEWHPLRALYGATLSWTVSYGPNTYGDAQRYKVVDVNIHWDLPE